MTQSTRTVLVTGVTSGVGHALARLLRQRGCRVIACCRNPAQQTRLEAAGVCDAAVLVDLALPETVRTVPRQLREQGVEALQGFLHCAAINTANPLETLKMEELRQMFEVNVFGSFSLLQGVIPFLRVGRGRIVLTGSTACFSVWPMMGAYCATKHALAALADAARRELWPWGIDVVLVRPGAIRTRMLENHAGEMRKRLDRLEGNDQRYYGKLYASYTKLMFAGLESATPPDEVAAVVLKAFEAGRPKTTYAAGSDGKLVALAHRLLPDRAIDFLTRKMFAAQ